MRTILLMPPAKGPTTTTSFFGKSYTCAANNFIRVNEFDAGILTANGWTVPQSPTRGPSTSRPPLLPTDAWQHWDTTLNTMLRWVGSYWVDLNGNRVADVQPGAGS